MTQPFIRAAAFAVLSLILLAVLSVLVFLVMIGVPKGADAMASFQAQAAQMAPTVDLVLGGLILLVCGWLAARPFAGRDAIITAGTMAVLYIVLDVLIVLTVGDVRQMSFATTGLSYAVKVAGALIGGWLASRTPARSVDTVLPETE
ncbi:hypothetical protein ACFSCW_02625 [Sphingomonas tabacisoli]|uniref:Uncharacterized protein n=1 Tax=Sphingomonas tabacisoli TaxID=2249466 RepID=A0ABW4HYJ1_9SPHN